MGLGPSQAHCESFYSLSPSLKEGVILGLAPETHLLIAHRGHQTEEAKLPILSMTLGVAENLNPKDPYSYPGDSETFAAARPVSQVLGCVYLGIWHETLDPGYRSAYPHAHSIEEECVYPLDEGLTLWLDGWRSAMTPGKVETFLPGTGLAHCIQNLSPFPSSYLCIGERAEFNGEKIIYPLNPSRMAQMKKLGIHWEEKNHAPQGQDSPLARG